MKIKAHNKTDYTMVLKVCKDENEKKFKKCLKKCSKFVEKRKQLDYNIELGRRENGRN